MQPLTNVLYKVFVNGFYRVHAGLLLFVFIAMIGLVPPQLLISYHKSLMLAMTSNVIVMLLSFLVWLIYTIKSCHYVTGALLAADQYFLFYSANSFKKLQQLKSWFYVQAAILLPVISYAAVAVWVGVGNHLYVLPLCIIIYLLILIYCSSVIYTFYLNRLVDGSNQSILLKLSAKWRKPYFSLYIYYIFDNKKVSYLITKALSWVIITGVFCVFSDVKTDQRVAGIAILAVITAHVVLIFEERRFEETSLSFARNLPYSRLQLFMNFVGVYLFLLIPEAIWLFSRFNPVMAFELLVVGLSTALLFHSLLYWFGLNMDKYLQWILSLFIVLFWIIMFKLLWVLIPLNLAVGFGLFYLNYYRSEAVVGDK